MRACTATFTAVLLACLPAAAQSNLWIEQLGSPAGDKALVTTSDGAGGLFVGGETQLGLAGPLNGSRGAWIARYDGNGVQSWIRQLSSSGEDLTWGLAPDGQGGAFVGGETSGSLGGPNAGVADAWLARYDAAGNLLWIQQFGTPGYDVAGDLAADGQGGFYASGATGGSLGSTSAGGSDGWVARFDSGGNLLWMRQLGTSAFDSVTDVETDPAGGVFLCGATTGNLVQTNAGEFDAWFGRYGSSGQQDWVRQMGTAGLDAAYALALDAAGGFFLCMTTEGNLGGPNLGDYDACVARIDAAGNPLWIRQFGTSDYDLALGAAADGAGGVFLVGSTGGDLAGSSLGFLDAWVRRLDSAGSPFSGFQLGTSSNDIAFSASADGGGGIFLCGETSGALAGPNAGAADAFVARFVDTCAPVQSYCTASGTSLPGCQAAIAATGAPSFSNPSGFALSSGSVPGGSLGLCLFGANGPANLPLGTLGGKLCVQPPFFRTAAHAGGGNPGVCNGSLAFTLQDLIDSSPIVAPGAVLHAEIWARDSANPDGYLLSNGAQLQVCP